MSNPENHPTIVNSDASVAIDAATSSLDVAVVGAGPAGLMAAEQLAKAGLSVIVFDRMPSPARKFLMAGRGGLNLTHSEPLEGFLRRYHGKAADLVQVAVRAFPPDALIAWAEGLGIATFKGSSGRIFPEAMKASPLLRAWLKRLDGLGVRLVTNRRLTSIEGGARAGPSRPIRLTFAAKDAAPEHVLARYVLLAMGGASWPRLGSDGAWAPLLTGHGTAMTPLEPANCGLLVPWSARLLERHVGTPLKRIVLTVGTEFFAGELIITRTGLEGGPAYAAGPALRAARIEASGAPVPIMLDLRPDIDIAALTARLAAPRGKASFANFLRKAAGLSPAATSILWETGPDEIRSLGPALLATRIKSARLDVTGTSGLDRAISTAGGIIPGQTGDGYMLDGLEGVFAAGEMLDWEAPTGGYLLQGCFATGLAAAQSILDRRAIDTRVSSSLQTPGSEAWVPYSITPE